MEVQILHYDIRTIQLAWIVFIFYFRPNVCPFQDIEMILVRVPCVQRYSRMVKVWKPNCGGTKKWCIGHERR